MKRRFFAFDISKGRDCSAAVMAEKLANGAVAIKRVYVLIGNEPFQACLDRVMEVIALGGEPHCQPVIKLNALQKEPQVRFDWTRQRLIDMARWSNFRIWKSTPRFKDYNRSYRSEAERLDRAAADKTPFFDFENKRHRRRP